MRNSAYRVAIIGFGKPQASGHLNAESYDSVDGVVAAPHAYNAVLLDLPASQAGSALRLLRKQCSYRYSLIYCCQDQDAWCRALGDGAPPVDDAAMTEAMRELAQRRSTLKDEILDVSFEARVLAWLWLNPARRRLVAVQNVDRFDFYAYPLLEALAGGRVFEPLELLHRLSRRGCIGQTELVGKVRFCACCGSWRLSQTRCLDCGGRHEQFTPRIQKIHNYQLTEAGHMHDAPGLHIDLAFGEHFDERGLIDEDAFRYSLDWLLDMHRRYGEPAFSLLSLRFVNLQQAVAALGQPQGNTALGTMVENLVDMMREADRCARTGEDVFWVLLPNTNKQGLAKVMQRVSRQAELFNDALPGMQLRMKGIAAPTDVQHSEDAVALMERVFSGVK